MKIRIKDNGNKRSIAFNNSFNHSGNVEKLTTSSLMNDNFIYVHATYSERNDKWNKRYCYKSFKTRFRSIAWIARWLDIKGYLHIK